MNEPRRGRMTLTLILSGCVFLVILVTVLLIGMALVIADQAGLLGRWMEHASLLRFFLIIAAMSLVCSVSGQRPPALHEQDDRGPP